MCDTACLIWDSVTQKSKYFRIRKISSFLSIASRYNDNYCCIDRSRPFSPLCKHHARWIVVLTLIHSQTLIVLLTSLLWVAKWLPVPLYSLGIFKYFNLSNPLIPLTAKRNHQFRETNISKMPTITAKQQKLPSNS